jgi:hypothetical protein
MYNGAKRRLYFMLQATGWEGACTSTETEDKPHECREGPEGLRGLKMLDVIRLSSS